LPHGSISYNRCSTQGATAVIGNLLKQLFKALGISMRHRLSRLFGRRAPNLQNTSSMAGTIPTVGLDPVYTKTVTWRTDQNDLVATGTASNPIYQLWRAMPRGHKWTHYFETYEAVFGARRNTPMRILEIGVLQGASLRLWKSYFQHPQTTLVGVDIEPACAQFDAPADGIHVRIVPGLQQGSAGAHACALLGNPAVHLDRPGRIGFEPRDRSP
jgi:hypothetical protein